MVMILNDDKWLGYSEICDVLMAMGINYSSQELHLPLHGYLP
jgi:hypothetical protein